LILGDLLGGEAAHHKAHDDDDDDDVDVDVVVVGILSVGNI
jgi:hypothetical protein